MQRRQIRLLHAFAQTPADDQLALAHVQLFLHAAGLVLQGVHAHVRAEVVVDLPAGQGSQCVAQDGDQRLLGRAAAVKDLDGAGLQQIVIVAGQLLVVDVLALALAAEASHREVLAAAHLLNAAKQGVPPLLVDAAADGLKHLFPLAVHILLQQEPAAGVGGEQHLAHQLRRVAQHVLPVGQKIPLGDAGVKADALNLPDPAHYRLDSGAVELVEPGGESLHIAVAPCAAAQHIGDEGVEGRGIPLQLGQQIQTQAGGFEFVRAQMAEPYAGENFSACQLHGTSFLCCHFLLSIP